MKFERSAKDLSGSICVSTSNKLFRLSASFKLNRLLFVKKLTKICQCKYSFEVNDNVFLSEERIPMRVYMKNNSRHYYTKKYLYKNLRLNIYPSESRKWHVCLQISTKILIKFVYLSLNYYKFLNNIRDWRRINLRIATSANIEWAIVTIKTSNYKTFWLFLTWLFSITFIKIFLTFALNPTLQSVWFIQEYRTLFANLYLFVARITQNHIQPEFQTLSSTETCTTLRISTHN